ncbi:unnamed protein product [Boreogadus saida]
MMMMKRTTRSLAVVVVLMLSQALARALGPNDPGETISKANTEVEEFLNRTRDLKANDVTLIFDPVVTIMSPLKAQHDKVFLMNATLGVYLQILSRVLAEPTPAPEGPGVPGGPEVPRFKEVRPALRKLQAELLRVKRHYYHGNQNNPLQAALDQLHAIKVDDPLVQRQALAEFTKVHYVVSNVGSRNINHTSKTL